MACCSFPSFLLLCLLLLISDNILKNLILGLQLYQLATISVEVWGDICWCSEYGEILFWILCICILDHTNKSTSNWKKVFTYCVFSTEAFWINIVSFLHDGSIYPSFIYSGIVTLALTASDLTEVFSSSVPDILSTRNVIEGSVCPVHAKYVVCLSTLLFSMEQWKIWAHDIVDHTIMIMLAWHKFLFCFTCTVSWNNEIYWSIYTFHWFF